MFYFARPLKFFYFERPTGCEPKGHLYDFGLFVSLKRKKKLSSEIFVWGAYICLGGFRFFRFFGVKFSFLDNDDVVVVVVVVVVVFVVPSAYPALYRGVRRHPLWASTSNGQDDTIDGLSVIIKLTRQL